MSYSIRERSVGPKQQNSFWLNNSLPAPLREREILICGNCGDSGVGTFCGTCGNNVAPKTLPNLGNALTWPFHQNGWYKTLWMPLAWFLLPGLGTLLSWGWEIDAIRRRARRDPVLIPQVGDIASLLKHGAVVAAMSVLYFVVPVGVLALFTKMSFLERVAEVWAFIVEIWRGHHHQSVGAFFLRKAIMLVTDSAMPILYVLFASPLFFVARLRYAVTNQVSSFFNLVANANFCFRKVGDILLYSLYVTAIRSAFIVFAGTVVGAIVPIILGGASSWILSYVAGQLGSELLLYCQPIRADAGVVSNKAFA